MQDKAIDELTLRAYEAGAAAYAQDWNAQPPADDMYALLLQFFGPGPTVDIGCGAGRDVAWLVAHGFDARGFDASDALLSIARQAHPGLRFGHAALPLLEGIEAGTYANVLCETVLMHLLPDQIPLAVAQLVALLRPGGTLYLSWRVTRGISLRDANGRLYCAFEVDAVLSELAQCELLLNEEAQSASSFKMIHRVIARRAPSAY